MLTFEEAFTLWCDRMAERRLLGPGCGVAEFEGADWREQVAWRVDAGHKPIWLDQIEQLLILQPRVQIATRYDKTVKHVFRLGQEVIEFTFINKDDGKDIVCVPTQTACRMGCTFCFLTGSSRPVKNLAAKHLISGLDYVLRHATVKQPTLLVSYMGSGEPLNNVATVIDSAYRIARKPFGYMAVRFAVASIIPSLAVMTDFTEQVRVRDLPLKFHLSLHAPFDERRRKLMPAAAGVAESLAALLAYRDRTRNPIEIHYTLIDAFNDRAEDVVELIRLLGGSGVPVKILALRERDVSELRASTGVSEFRSALEAGGVPTEFYDPPGADIGASCGQFMSDPERLVALRSNT